MLTKVGAAFISSILTSGTLILVATMNVSTFNNAPKDYNMWLIGVLHIFGVFLLGGIPSSIIIDSILHRMKNVYSFINKITIFTLYCLFGFLVISMYLTIIMTISPDKEKYLHPSMAFIIAPIASYTFYQIDFLLSYLLKVKKENIESEKIKESFKKIKQQK